MTLVAGGAWRAEIAVRCADLRHRLDVAVASRDGGATFEALPGDAELLAASDGVTSVVDVVIRTAERTERDVRLDGVKSAIGDAESAAEPSTNSFQRLAQWWTGSAATVAWESVHIAEAGLIQVGSEEDVRAAVPRLRAWIANVMPASRRALYDDPLKRMQEPGKNLDRAAVRSAYAAAITANNDKHVRLRDFRNLLLAVSFFLALVLVTIGVWHALHPAAIGLCSDAADGDRCFGGAKPTGRAVFEIEAIGALGGLLGVALMLTKLRTAPTRYNVVAAQAVLKPAAGAAAALIGVLLLQSGLIVSPVATGTAAMLAYAAAFGFSQQLLTRFIDKQGARLLGEKDDDKDQ